MAKTIREAIDWYVEKHYGQLTNYVQDQIELQTPEGCHDYKLLWINVEYDKKAEQPVFIEFIIALFENSLKQNRVNHTVRLLSAIPMILVNRILFERQMIRGSYAG